MTISGETRARLASLLTSRGWKQSEITVALALLDDFQRLLDRFAERLFDRMTVEHSAREEGDDLLRHDLDALSQRVEELIAEVGGRRA